jgi:hypothetical protein
VSYLSTVSALRPDFLVPTFMLIISQLFFQNTIFIYCKTHIDVISQWCHLSVILEGVIIMIKMVSLSRSVDTSKISRHNVSFDCLHLSKNVGTINQKVGEIRTKDFRTRCKRV